MAPIFTGDPDVVAVGVGVALEVVAIAVDVGVTEAMDVTVEVFSPPFPPQAGTSRSIDVTKIKSNLNFFDFNIFPSQ